MVLLDVNALIALGDQNHTDHRRVSEWFLANSRDGWATCPLTENGFVRILGHANYPNGPGSPTVARDLLAEICRLPGHQFWPDEATLRETAIFPKLTTSRQVTDLYLLALAVQKAGRLATLDERMDASLVPGGKAAYCLIP
jgi:toxin-antitoxin system PIN domain toxin